MVTIADAVIVWVAKVRVVVVVDTGVVVIEDHRIAFVKNFMNKSDSVRLIRISAIVQLAIIKIATSKIAIIRLQYCFIMKSLAFIIEK